MNKLSANSVEAIFRMRRTSTITYIVVVLFQRTLEALVEREQEGFFPSLSSSFAPSAQKRSFTSRDRLEGK